MRYKAILIDADDTLFDFQIAEHEAIREVFLTLGIHAKEAPEVYGQINKGCWEAFEKGMMSQAQLKVERFARLLNVYDSDKTPEHAAELYIDALGRQPQLIDGALDVVQEIAKKLPIAIVTNGIAAVQHGRLNRSALKPYIHSMIISEELGIAKPNPRMINEALASLGRIAPENALMVGDSLSSDVRCANNAGVDACWYNPGKKPIPQGIHVRYIIDNIRELPGIALCQTE